MLPHNLLKLIAELLPWTDLVAFSRVCRGYQTVAEDRELWKAECRRLWGADLQAFGYISLSEVVTSTLSCQFPKPLKSWKRLFEQGYLAQCMWSELLRGDFLTRTDIDVMRSNCVVTFKQPELPLPKLRREARCFDSILQEALAYPEQDNTGLSLDMRDPEVLMALELLDQASKSLYDEIQTDSDMTNLLCARWNFPLERHSGLPVVLQLLCVLHANAQFQCEYHLRELQENVEGTALLSDYCRRVTAT